MELEERREIFRRNAKKANEMMRETSFKDGTSLATLTSKLSKANKSGHKGIHWDTKGRKWRAQIYFQGVNHYLGMYVELEEAVKARKVAEQHYFQPVLEKYGQKLEV